jgi:hypothetical protein
MKVKKSATTGLYAPGDVHFNQPLTSVAVNYVAGTDREPGFVSDRVFPAVPVAKQSDLYYVLDDTHVGDNAEPRAPGTESAGGSLALSKEPYYAPVWAWHVDLPDQLRANVDSELALDSTATRTVMRTMMLSREVSWARSFFNKSAWDYSVDGASAATAPGDFDPTDDANNAKLFWDDPASTPIEDVRQAQRYVIRGAGGAFKPNVLVTTRPVFDALLDHPDVVARLDRGQTPGGPAMANEAALAALFGLREVLVMDAVYRAQQEGPNQFVQENGALLAYAAAAPSLLDASAGYTFQWTGYSGSENQGIRVRKFRMEQLESDRVEGGAAFAHKVGSKRLGFYFNDIVENAG